MLAWTCERFHTNIYIIIITYSFLYFMQLLLYFSVTAIMYCTIIIILLFLCVTCLFILSFFNV